LRSFWAGAQALTVADRRVELDYVFDRLGDLQLIQAYRLLVPERHKLIERGKNDESSSDLRQGLFGQAEERSDDCESDLGAEGVRKLIPVVAKLDPVLPTGPKGRENLAQG
jgi:hypothetical protein